MGFPPQMEVGVLPRGVTAGGVRYARIPPQTDLGLNLTFLQLCALSPILGT